MGDNTKAPSQLDMGDNERASQTGAAATVSRITGLADRRSENFKKLRICVNRIVELQTAKCWYNTVLQSTRTKGLIAILMRTSLLSL